MNFFFFFILPTAEGGSWNGTYFGEQCRHCNRQKILAMLWHNDTENNANQCHGTFLGMFFFFSPFFFSPIASFQSNSKVILQFWFSFLSSSLFVCIFDPTRLPYQSENESVKGCAISSIQKKDYFTYTFGFINTEQLFFLIISPKGR